MFLKSATTATAVILQHFQPMGSSYSDPVSGKYLWDHTFQRTPWGCSASPATHPHDTSLPHTEYFKASFHFHLGMDISIQNIGICYVIENLVPISLKYSAERPGSFLITTLDIFEKGHLPILTRDSSSLDKKRYSFVAEYPHLNTKLRSDTCSHELFSNEVWRS